MKATAPRLDRKVQVAFALAIAALLAVGVVSYRNAVASRNSEKWVRHTYEVLEHLDGLNFAMARIESSSRGFALTGRQSYLDTYRAGLVKASRDQAAVHNLTVDNRTQQLRLPALDELAAKKIHRSDMVIGRRQTEGLESVVEYVSDGQGQRMMTEFQALVGQMEDEELRLLTIRSAEDDRRQRQTTIVFTSGSVLGLLVAGFAGFSNHRDNARRALAELRMGESEARFRDLANNISQLAWMTDEKGWIFWYNQRWLDYTGTTLEEMAGWGWRKVHDPDHVQRVVDKISECFKTGQIWEDTFPLRGRDGTYRWFLSRAIPIRDSDGKVTRWFGTNTDITETREMALQITHLAQHDFLTGLPNRVLLDDRVAQAIALAPRHKTKVAVLFLDLDGFKHINDFLGHPTGDKLLQSVAQRLKDCVRGSDSVSRQGGDEFVVLLSEVSRSEDAAITATRILQAVAAPHFIDHQDLHVTTSIGVAVYPEDGMNAETLIKNADTAMYQAKADGRRSYQFFKPSMNARAVERRFVEEGLQHALDREEFAIQYQPKIDLRSGAITGAEALLRWAHPERGPMSPAQFLPIAEESGLILPISTWVLREACKQAKAWSDSGLPSVTMAIGVSAMQLRSGNFLDDILAVLRETGLEPQSLELGLAESILMQAKSAEPSLRALRESGVQVAIDDFGTGHSGLSYLRRFPIDALRIDQSFIRQISREGDAVIVAALIDMVKGLKLRAVAKGVATRAELEFLQARHCDEAQGYYFSRPLRPEQFAALLKSDTRVFAPPSLA